jgi:DUF2075 family protein
MSTDESNSRTPSGVAPAWYDATISDFLSVSDNEVLGTLIRRSAAEQEQVRAWQEEITILRRALDGLEGHVILEFDIPRVGSRADAIILIGVLVFVIEFKVGAKTFDRAATEQVWDYALDLKNFHRGSHSVAIVPILVATEAPASTKRACGKSEDGVCEPIWTDPSSLREVMDEFVHTAFGKALNATEWRSAPYHPTPTIIEAARAMYSKHSVEAIARHDAGAVNLQVTSQRIERLIAQAQEESEKIIIFLTGVPGAGKTLVGLNVATVSRHQNAGVPAVFLSGNGPLVEVLRAALIRDEKRRLRPLGGARANPMHIASQAVKAFIQNVHHFRDAALADNNLPPFEHVAIFDEAQRAWNHAKTANFMRQRKGQTAFADSEPAFLIRYLNRHKDWAAIVCLVGGGQEIHTGEAGIAEWLMSVSEKFSEWKIYVSSRLMDAEYAVDAELKRIEQKQAVVYDDCLHLSVSMRSFRAEKVSAFVKALLDREIESARELTRDILPRFPIRITRDLNAAKDWVRSRARGSERYGMLASSKALRLKPHAIDVRSEVDPVHWFLDDRDDTRSSFYLEDCATEFQVQGLELDWTVISWDADFRSRTDSWSYHEFKGKRWQSINATERKLYLKNAYRVLLTRARQGMAIFVPPGNSKDLTRPPEFYDETFAYLSAVGIPTLGLA